MWGEGKEGRDNAEKCSLVFLRQQKLSLVLAVSNMIERLLI